MKHISTYLIVFFICTPIICAQTISGRVVDAQTDEPIPSASVMIKSLKARTLTNAEGRFRLSITPSETSIPTLLECSFPGYVSKSITLASPINFSMEPICKLESTSWAVEIEGNSDKQMNFGVIKLDAAALARIPTALESDVFRALKTVPGVKNASDFSSGLYIRGSSPDQTLISLDGATIFNPSHFFGFFSAFNPEALKSVTLYKGPSPARFGGRLGGTLHLENKDGADTISGNIAIGLLSTKGKIEGGSKKLNWMFAARHSTLKPALSLMQEWTSDIPNSLSFYDINAHIQLKPSEKTQLSATYYRSADGLDMKLSTGLQLNLWYQNTAQILEHRLLYAPNKVWHTKFIRSSYQSKPNGGLGGTGARRDTHIQELKAETEWILSHKQHTFEAGLQLARYSLKWRDWFAGSYTEPLNLHQAIYTVYAQDHMKLLHKWSLNAGLRLSSTLSSSVQVEPRVTLKKQFGKKWIYEVSYGRAHQWLGLLSNEAFSAFDTWLLATSAIKPIRGDQFSTGIRYSPTSQNLSWHLEAYYKTMDDLFSVNPLLPDLNGLSFEQLLIFGNGKAFGVESAITFQHKALICNIAYTLSKTTRTFPELNRGRAFTPKFDRLHDLMINASYPLSKMWKLDGTFSFASGQPYTEPKGHFSIPNPFGQSFNNIGGIVLMIDSFNNARLPSYHRLDISATRTAMSRFGFKKAWTFSLVNAYNHRNIWYYNFVPTLFGVKRSFVQQLPIMPNVSFTATF